MSIFFCLMTPQQRKNHGGDVVGRGVSSCRIMLCSSPAIRISPQWDAWPSFFPWTVGEAGTCCYDVWSHNSIQLSMQAHKDRARWVGLPYPQVPHWRIPGKLQGRNLKALLISDAEKKCTEWAISYSWALCPSTAVQWDIHTHSTDIS